MTPPAPVTSTLDERFVSLQEIAATTLRSGSLHEALGSAVHIIARAGRVDVCSILLREDDEFVMRATVGLPEYLVGSFTVREGIGIAGAAAAERKTVVSPDARSDPRFVEPLRLPEAEVPPGMYQSVAATPIVNLLKNEVLGILSVQSHARTDFDLGTTRYLEVAATQIAIACETFLLRDQTADALTEKVEHLQSIQKITTAMAARLDPNDLAQSVVDEARPLISASLAVVAVASETPEGLVLTFPAYSDVEPQRRIPEHVNWNGPIGEAVRSGRVVRVSDLESDPEPRWDGMVRSWATHNRLRAVAAVPLTARGRILGALAVFKSEAHEFTNDEVGLLSAFATQTAVFLDNARLYQEAQASNEVKTTLLAEMHHRVKNNLATIAGLLKLQANDVRSPHARRPLLESVQRIHSIGMVHDLLSRKDIGQTSIAEVSGRMTEMLRANLLPAKSSIRVENRADDVILNSQQATSFALILNELIANALEHGLAESDHGLVRIEASRAGKRVVLMVSDDGRGLPEGFSLERDRHLGLQIVEMLVKTDLRGDLKLEPANPGTRVTVVFPIGS